MSSLDLALPRPAIGNNTRLHVTVKYYCSVKNCCARKGHPSNVNVLAATGWVLRFRSNNLQLKMPAMMETSSMLIINCLILRDPAAPCSVLAAVYLKTMAG